MPTADPPDQPPATVPALDLQARLGWRTRYSEIILADPPSLVLQATPVFPLCHPALVERGIVWDVMRLVDSVKRPGGHQVLTSDCGYPPDSGLEGLVHVSHPDTRNIVWELDIRELNPALADRLAGANGFIRLNFERDRYEADVRALIRDLRDHATRSIRLEDLQETFGFDALESTYPTLKTLQVDRLEPDHRGMDLDPEAPWAPEPLWPPGTLVEFGFFVVDDGQALMRVDGEPRRLDWPPRFFTRWETLSAFKNWIALVHRGFALPFHHRDLPSTHERNRFFLLQEQDRARCHAAGRSLAETVQRHYREGETAPDVSVRYVECPLAASAA